MNLRLATSSRRACSTRLVSAALAAACVAAPPGASAGPVQVDVARPAVIAALDDVATTTAGGPLYAPREPRRLRPCCAFGGRMKVKLGVVPLPWYRHKPVRGPSDIGPHEYDPGLLQILPGPVRLAGDHPSREHNGIVYTCRAGFLDTAHVRDFADLTFFLAARVESLLESGGTIDLLDYGGARRITVHAIAPERLRAAGRTALAIAIAARVAFELSVWREIATWYGYESVPPWPEKLSSFSPEDLYSNLFGTRLAAGILRSTSIHSKLEWDRAMSAWLMAALDAMRVVPKESAAAAMDSVNGAWWNSRKWIPDWRITMRRKFDAGPVVEPWLARWDDAAGRTSPGPCAGAGPAQALHVADELAGVSLSDAATIEVVASSDLVERGLPLAKKDDRRVGEPDFGRLIEDVRRRTSRGLEADVAAIARGDRR